MKASAFIILAALAATGLLGAPAYAAELRILDVNGIDRAVGEIDESGASVEFFLSNVDGAPAGGVPVFLTRQATATEPQQVLQSVSQHDGVAQFQGVGPGIWTVSSSPDKTGVLFTKVGIVEGTLLAGMGGGSVAVPAMIGIGATGGAAVGIAALTDRNNKDSAPPLSAFE